MEIGKLELVDLRELWRHEERGFSAWLASNLDILADTLGITLQNAEREMDAGDFACDLVVEGEQNRRVIIENQLEATDHSHLGKMITYLTNLDAKTAIWITKHPRPEHIRAVQWLNEVSPDDTAFYLVRLAAYRIAESHPAPLFTVIVGPSEESKDLGKQKKHLAERHRLRYEFWEQLLARAKQRGVLTHAQRAPSTESWISAGAGVRSGVSFIYTIWASEQSAVDLYIDTGDKTENENIFDRLYSRKADVESGFGKPLEWERLDDKRACRVRHVIKVGGLDAGKEVWPAIQDATIEAMDRLAKSLKPVLSKL